MSKLMQDLSLVDGPSHEREAEVADTAFFRPRALAQVYRAKIEYCLEAASGDWPVRYWLYARQVRQYAKELEDLVVMLDSGRRALVPDKPEQPEREVQPAVEGGIPPYPPPDATGDQKNAL